MCLSGGAGTIGTPPNVNTLDRWLHKTAVADSKRPILEESLLAGQFCRYLWYRLRFFFYARALGFVIHLIEFGFLVHVFSDKAFGTSLVAHNSIALAGAFWWGVLDVLRNQLRAVENERESAILIGRWLARSVIVAIAILSVTIVFVAVQVTSQRAEAFGVVDVFVLILCMRLAIDVVIRTYYSAVYSRRRVYRPVTAIFATELVGFAAVLATWSHLGSWSFPLGVAISTVISRAIVYRYTARSYEAMQLPEPRLRFREAVSGLRRELGTMGAAGLASTSTRIGSIVVLVLLLRNASRVDGLIQVTHLLAPLLVGAASWPFLFYLDFKRLENPAARMLRTHLQSKMLVTSVLLGLGFWAVAAVLIGIYNPISYLAIFAIASAFVAQSVLANIQLQQFSLQNYGHVAISYVGLGCAILLAVVGALPLTICIVVGCFAIFTSVWRASAKQSARSRGPISLNAWVAAMRLVSTPVSVGAITIANSRRDRILQVANWLADRLRDGEAVCVAANHRLLWYELGNTSQIARNDMIGICAGLVREITVSSNHANGGQALSALFRDSKLRADPIGIPANCADLVKECEQRFAQAIVVDLSKNQSCPPLRDLSPQLRQDLWRNACRAARGTKGRIDGYDITTYAPGGEIHLVFAIPRTIPATERTQWREKLRSANWSAPMSAASSAV